MEYFSDKKGINYWSSVIPNTEAQQSILDGEFRNLTEDTFTNFSELMALDSFAGWCSSPMATEQVVSSYGLSSLLSATTNYSPYDQMMLAEPSNVVYPCSDSGICLNVVGSTQGFDKTVDPHSVEQFSLPMSSLAENVTNAKQDNVSSLLLESVIPRPIGSSIDDRMLRALSLFKESFRGGILAQVWVPIRNGENYVLSTCEQPYLLDEKLLGYREVCRSYTFSVENKLGSFPGLPGRVYISKIPEWTSDVGYYSSAEYVRVNHARDHEVHGSIAIPIFNTVGTSCCGVLELVTLGEKPNFDAEMESVCRALKAVDLRTTALPRLHPQHFLPSQRTALAEITDILRAVCHVHRLPLALTWIPCTLEEDSDKIVGIEVKDCKTKPYKKTVLSIEETACYVNDKEMQGFVRACVEHLLEEGQGVAGKALRSNVPSFSSDVKGYHINEYPLVQHARKYSLNAAVAIRLRSTYTGDDDYILEFFLPLNIKRTKEQQQLLDSLSCTMQKICRSLRTVTDAELDGFVNCKVDESKRSNSFFSRDLPMMISQPLAAGSELNEFEEMPLDKPTTNNDSSESGGSSVQASVKRCHVEKKRSVAEKTVSLSVLQQYFSGSLKDAAKSIGVCPTTLKRICRQYGISRWPSRKISKVNRSLRKIQTVLESVEGVEGRLKFDPSTGELVATGSAIQEYDSSKSLFSPGKSEIYAANTGDEASLSTSMNGEISMVKFEKDMTQNQSVSCSGVHVSMNGEEQKSYISSSFHAIHCNSLPGHLSKVRMEKERYFKQNQLSASSITDSSNGSGSLSSPPNNCDTQSQLPNKASLQEGGLMITVKATYKEDTSRFKFDPSSGYLHLYEEVASRFKLQLGAFQLKYLDDEEEWVMLVSDSDLHECLEIMEFSRKRSAKILVRDIPCSMGSSSSSNCFLAGSQ